MQSHYHGILGEGTGAAGSAGCFVIRHHEALAHSSAEVMGSDMRDTLAGCEMEHAAEAAFGRA